MCLLSTPVSGSSLHAFLNISRTFVLERFQSCCIPERVEQAFRPAVKLIEKPASAAEVKLYGIHGFEIPMINRMISGNDSATRRENPTTRPHNGNVGQSRWN
jgi:hypothetical protein